ncbi:MAG: hypothetical protein C4567_13305 [Deltaproteobacteria bacterium]|nr:MAG: hypothetical protein C4567_13305 [Deltaproteobacteria bacterium]
MKGIFTNCLFGLVMAAMVCGTPASYAAAAAEPVHFKELLPFVELKLSGWEMSDKPSGATVKHEGFSMSEAKASFHAGDKTLEVIILDFMGQAMPWLGMLGKMEMESSEESIRTITIGGFKALETFRPKEKHGDLNISVADRFWVKVEGEGIDNTEPLKTAAGQMDLKKLATLAK